MSNPVSPTESMDEESIIDLTYRFDWSKTSLGDISTWPFSLKNAVVSKFPCSTDQYTHHVDIT